MSGFNSNLLLNPVQPVAASAAPMALATMQQPTTVEMERRRRRACKHGRTKAGRCRKS